MSEEDFAKYLESSDPAELRKGVLFLVYTVAALSAQLREVQLDRDRSKLAYALATYKRGRGRPRKNPPKPKSDRRPGRPVKWKSLVDHFGKHEAETDADAARRLLRDLVPGLPVQLSGRLEREFERHARNLAKRASEQRKRSAVRKSKKNIRE